MTSKTKRPETGQSVEIVGLMIEMNMRPHPPTPDEMDHMIEAARIPNALLGKIARQGISKMSDEEIGLWFKRRIGQCIKRHGNKKRKSVIEGISRDDGWEPNPSE